MLLANLAFSVTKEARLYATVSFRHDSTEFYVTPMYVIYTNHAAQNFAVHRIKAWEERKGALQILPSLAVLLDT